MCIPKPVHISSSTYSIHCQPVHAPGHVCSSVHTRQEVTRLSVTCYLTSFHGGCADGAMYFNKGTISDGAQASDVQNVMGVLFSTSAFQGMFNLMSAMPVVGFERSGA